MDPIFDDGAPYVYTGIVDLRILADNTGFKEEFELRPITVSLGRRMHYQHGTGRNASSCRRIIGSGSITAKYESGRDIEISHIVLEGSSQWLIRRNLTTRDDSEQVHGCAVKLCVEN